MSTKTITLRNDGFPDTTFQAWLAKNDACLPGRARVGSKSFTQYWRTCKVKSDMHWLWSVWVEKTGAYDYGTNTSFTQSSALEERLSKLTLKQLRAFGPPIFDDLED